MAGEHPTSIMHLECHVSGTDPFSTPETEARGDRYGVSGIPHVVTDGKFEDIGAGSCGSAANTYRARYNARMTETGGISPVAVSGYWTFNGTTGAFQVDVEQLDPGAFTSGYQVTMFLAEDDIFWCCGYGGVNTWHGVARVVKTEPVTLSGVGGTDTVVADFLFDPSWNPANLHAYAVFEQTAGTMVIVQAGSLTEVHDFSIDLPVRIASVPEMNGTAELTGSISNESDVADVLDISIGNIGSWPADFMIEGDPNVYTTHSLPLGPGESKGITIFVHTDGVKTIGSGEMEVGSENTGRVQPASMRVWNGSHSILFVDDDNNAPYEGPYETALTNLGYLYDDWNVAAHGSNEPKATDMIGFDAVVWQTGYVASGIMTAEDIAEIQEYLDDGGALFLSSMDFLFGITNPNPFVNEYLGVASWVANTKANTATGVAGDPITDGMVLPLTWPSSAANRVDNLTPAAGASAILTSEIGPGNPAAVRNELGNGSRTVFNTIPQNVMSSSDPDPNNSETVIERTLIWLLDQGTTDVGDGLAAGPSRVMSAFPNPFGPSTELRFAISSRAASQPVTLQVVDASGRLVRQLANGPMAEGVHNLVWDGSDDGGHVTPAGLYFAKLQSEDGESAFKIVRMR